MTDKELLEAAAKAASVKLHWHAGKTYMRPDMEPMDSWNPLTDDGDALRLAVKLEMLVDLMQLRVVAGRRTPEVCIDFEEGEYCRAIVRAAAAMASGHNVGDEWPTTAHSAPKNDDNTDRR